MVMLESLHEHNPHAHVYVLCLSDQCYDGMQKLGYPFVTLIQLKDFEAATPELVAVRPTRSLVEYYFTMTPCLPWYILHTVDNINAVTYLDADMMFFSSVEPIFEEAGDASVILTPHNFAPHLQHCIKFGIYNVSWVTFFNTEDGLSCLSWYKNMCLDWCYDRHESEGVSERFADQKYLDYMPQQFLHVHAIRHSGVGIAPWNLGKLNLSVQNTHVLVDGSPLIFYHAQGFVQLCKGLYASGLGSYKTHLSPIMRTHIFSPYCEAYTNAAHYITHQLQQVRFFSIRNAHNSTPLSLAKRILQEARKKSLIVCLDKLFSRSFS